MNTGNNPLEFSIENFQKEKLLRKIFSQHKKVNLPNTLWASYLVEKPVKMLVFSKIQLLSVTELEKINAPVTVKQVCYKMFYLLPFY